MEADAVVKRSVVSKSAVLRTGCKVTQSILMSGVEVGPKAVLQRVILCPGSKVGKDCKVSLCTRALLEDGKFPVVWFVKIKHQLHCQYNFP